MKKTKAKKVETSVSETEVGFVTKEILEDAKAVVAEVQAKKDAEKVSKEKKASDKVLDKMKPLSTRHYLVKDGEVSLTGTSQESNEKHRQYVDSMAKRIFSEINVAKAKRVGSCSIKIDEAFGEGTAALFVEELEASGNKVEFLDKRGADYRIMAISW